MLTHVATAPGSLVQDERGDLYHRPTLERLHAEGKLSRDTPAYRALMRLWETERPRAIA